MYILVKFACKIFYLDEIIRCSFGLSKTESKLLRCMINENNEMSIQDISTKSKLERSTIQKSLKLLLDKHLVDRHQINNSKGGFSFMYKSITKRDFQKRMNDIIDVWYQEARKEIKKI